MSDLRDKIMALAGKCPDGDWLPTRLDEQTSTIDRLIKDGTPQEVKPVSTEAEVELACLLRNSLPEIVAALYQCEQWRDRYEIAREREDTADARAKEHVQREMAGLRAEVSRYREQASELAHVVLEAGVVPGIRLGSGCRCDECRSVARQMASVGYLDGVEDRWWVQAEADTAVAQPEAEKCQH